MKLYENYCDQLLYRPNLLFVKYEDMVASFEPWLDGIIEFLGVDAVPEVRSKIIREADFHVERLISMSKKKTFIRKEGK
ncbi:MAG: sulfotransferase domain-containing protein [Candidatus Omnitrophota bacterium]|nr:sulfotransferase domain-containing protein [Candidatus Omnitrophota bacterium]